MKANTHTVNKGFTLIELLITIVIIGVLATISVSTFNNYIENAKISAAQAEMSQFQKALQIANSLTEKSAREITGSNNSGVNCTYGLAWYNELSCTTKWNDALEKISIASQIELSGLETDPWGKSYIFDENEGEYGSTDCRNDFIISRGPNEQRYGGDDIQFTIPNYSSSCL